MFLGRPRAQGPSERPESTVELGDNDERKGERMLIGHFVNDDPVIAEEYIVLAEEEDELRDFCRSGFRLSCLGNIETIRGNIDYLPANTELYAK